MFSECLSFGGLGLRISGETPWQQSPVCAPFRTAGESAEHEIYVAISSALPAPPENAVSSRGCYRWRCGAERHMLHDNSFNTSYSVTRGNVTELILSPHYAENLRTQLILEEADLFDILAERGMLVLHSSYVLRAEGDAILFSGATVEEGAVVENSVIMNGAHIRKGARIRRAIVAENAVVGCDSVVGGNGRIAVVGQDAVLPEYSVVKPGEQIDAETAAKNAAKAEEDAK